MVPGGRERTRTATSPARSAQSFLARPTRVERVTVAFWGPAPTVPALQGRCPCPANQLNEPLKAPVAQLDRALPSEGKGHTFESCRVRHQINNLTMYSFGRTGMATTWLPATRCVGPSELFRFRITA